MKNRLFSLLNSKGQSYLIEANSPEVALVKANRLGDQGWHIADELSVDEYCYRVTKTKLGEGYDELTDELYQYFTKEELEAAAKELSYIEEHPEEYKSYSDIDELKEALLSDE